MLVIGVCFAFVDYGVYGILVCCVLQWGMLACVRRSFVARVGIGS